MGKNNNKQPAKVQYNNIFHEKLANDIKENKTTNKTIIQADKTRNYIKMTTGNRYKYDHNKFLKEIITRTQKKSITAKLTVQILMRKNLRKNC